MDVLEELKLDGYALQHATAEQQADKAVVLVAVQQEGYALEFASLELQGNKEVVLAAVRCSGNALADASDDLKKNKQVVLAAVSQNGVSLRYASDDLKDDEDVVLAAVRKNGIALQHASEVLKNNKQVVLAAVSQNGVSLRYASEPLLDDEDILVCAIMVASAQSRWLPPEETVDNCLDAAARSIASLLLRDDSDVRLGNRNLADVAAESIATVMYKEWRYLPTKEVVHSMGHIKESLESVEEHRDFVQRAGALLRARECSGDGQDVDMVRELGARRGVPGFDTDCLPRRSRYVNAPLCFSNTRVNIGKLNKALYEIVYSKARYWLLQCDLWMRSARSVQCHQASRGDVFELHDSGRFYDVVHKTAGAIAQRASMHRPLGDFDDNKIDSLLEVDYLSPEYLTAQIHSQFSLNCSDARLQARNEMLALYALRSVAGTRDAACPEDTMEELLKRHGDLLESALCGSSDTFAQLFDAQQPLLEMLRTRPREDGSSNSFASWRETVRAVSAWAKVHGAKLNTIAPSALLDARDSTSQERARALRSVRCCGAAIPESDPRGCMPLPGFARLRYSWGWCGEQADAYTRVGLRGPGLRIAMLASMLLELQKHDELREGVVALDVLKEACQLAMQSYEVATSILLRERALIKIGFRAQALLNAVRDRSSAMADAVDVAQAGLCCYSLQELEHLFEKTRPDGTQNPVRHLLEPRLESKLREFMCNKITPCVPLSYTSLSVETLDDLLLPALRCRRLDMRIDPSTTPSALGEMLRTICRLKHWVPSDGAVIINKKDLDAAHPSARFMLEQQARRPNSGVIATHASETGKRSRKPVGFEFPCARELWRLLHE